MAEQGWYYLHTNGDLVWKRFAPEADSPFVKHLWEFDTSNRADAWRIVLEGLALGARLERIKELADKWGCTKADAFELLSRVEPSELMKAGMDPFIQKVLTGDVQSFWAEFLAWGEEKNREK